MNNAAFVAISDLHFNEKNLEVASAALQQAIDKAKELEIPLIIAGDLNDTKAIIRAEVANKLIRILREASETIKIAILVGNHDLINEKGVENSLNFLSPYADIISHTRSWEGINLVPYQTDPDQFLTQINRHEGLVVCHQGVLGAFMGEYIQDKSSVNPLKLKQFTIISGHYHRHQTVGTVTYIGTPYTTSFSEANDPEKGFLIVNADGTFIRWLTSLRRHIIIERDLDELTEEDFCQVHENDLLWIKLHGPESELKKIKKSELGKKYLGRNDFKLDLISTDTTITNIIHPKGLSNTQILDILIEDLSETRSQKDKLKGLYLEILGSTS